MNARDLLKLMFNHRKRCVLSLAIAYAGAAIPNHFRNCHVEEKGGLLRETEKRIHFRNPKFKEPCTQLVLCCCAFVCAKFGCTRQLSCRSGKGNYAPHEENGVVGQLCAARVLMACISIAV